MGNRAYLFGTPDYDQPAFGTLPVVNTDLELMRKVLEYQGYKVESKPGLTRGNLSAELRGCIRDCHSCEKLVVYYSGHGLHFDGEDFIVPKDGRTDDPLRFKEYFVSTDISSVAFESKAKSILFLVDACRAGLVLRNKGVQAASWGNRVVERAGDTQLAVLYSCKPGQLSHHTDEGSVFTLALAKCLDEAEQPLGLGELVESLERKMREVCSDHMLPKHGPRLLSELAPGTSPKSHIFFPKVSKGFLFQEDRMTDHGLKNNNTEVEPAQGPKARAAEVLAALAEPSISHQFGVKSSFEKLVERLAKRPLLQRTSLVSKILDSIGKGLALVGPPGIGKTALLSQLEGVKLPVVYCSLKGKSLEQSVYTLYREAAESKGQVVQIASTELEAIGLLETQIRSGHSLFLLDDCDLEPEIIERLSSVPDLFESSVLCSRKGLSLPNLPELQIPPLTREEIEEVLEAQGRTLTHSKLEALINQSGGNPLYLSHYLAKSLETPPESLDQYQSSILNELSQRGFDLVNLLAFARGPLPISIVSNLLRADESPQEIRNLLIELGALVELSDQRLELFHAEFAQFICSEAHRHGYSQVYLHQLADGFAAFDPPRSISYGVRCGIEYPPEQILEAAWSFANQLKWSTVCDILLTTLPSFQNSADQEAQGSAYLALAEAYRETSRPVKAREMVNNARDVLSNVTGTLRISFSMYDTMIGIDHGDNQDALTKLTTLLEQLDPSERHARAVLLSNLAWAYLKLGEPLQGVDSATQAIEIFEQLGSRRGLDNALSNLSACMGQIPSYDPSDLVDRAQKIVERGTSQNNPRLSAIGHNHLARAYRKMDQPRAAVKASKEAIRLCQVANVREMELSNISNLGNALLDLRLYSEAEKAYLEALAGGKQGGFSRVVYHSEELLGKLYLFHENDHVKALPYLERATEMAKNYGDQYRKATSEIKLAEAYKRAGRIKEAAEAFERAGRAHSKFSDWGEVAAGLHKAAELYVSLDEHAHANSLAIEAAHAALRDTDPGEANNILISVDMPPESSIPIYSKILRAFGDGDADTNFVGTVLNYAFDCQMVEDVDAAFKEFVQDFIELAKSPDAMQRVQVLRALAVAIMAYSTRYHPLAFSKRVIRELGKNSVFKAYVDQDGVETCEFRLASGRALIRIECLSELPAVIASVFGICLLLKSRLEYLEKDIDELGGPKDESILIYLMDEEMAIRKLNIPPLPSYGHASCQCTFSESAVPFGKQQPPTNVIFHKGFSKQLDSNEALPVLKWLMMNFYRSVVSHFCWLPNERVSAIRAGAFADQMLFGKSFLDSTD